MDQLTVAERSALMARIRSTANASTEGAFVQELRRRRVTGWRRKSTLVGKPDIVFPKQRIVVFVDGCFWHGCPKCRKRPKSNAGFWLPKITRNRRRDRFVASQLRSKGYRVLRVWEHDLKAGRISNAMAYLQAMLGHAKRN